MKNLELLTNIVAGYESICFSTGYKLFTLNWLIDGLASIDALLILHIILINIQHRSVYIV